MTTRNLGDGAVHRPGAGLIGVVGSSLLIAACGVGSIANAGHMATHGEFASSSGSGGYSIAQAAGTAYDPGDLEIYVNASPAQQASITWGTTCLESSGGAGSKLQQKETMNVPAVIHVSYPKGSVQCILSANSQLSQTGTVTVELFNGGAPHIATSVGPTGNTGGGSTGTDSLQTNTRTGVETSAGTPSSCSSESVDLGDLGTWTVAASGVSCQAAGDVLNQYENASLRADGTTQPLGPWSCRLTKFVPFQADTNNGYEAWRCSQGPDWVTFATGNPALANKPGATPPTGAPAGFSSNGQGPAGSVADGSYSGIAQVGSWGPVPDRVSCPQGNGFTVDIGSQSTECPFGAAIYQVVKEAHAATGTYPAKVSAGSYTATCQGGGNAGSITAPPFELTCADSARKLYVVISVPV
jgi:hypothetical protein